MKTFPEAIETFCASETDKQDEILEDVKGRFNDLAEEAHQTPEFSAAFEESLNGTMGALYQTEEEFSRHPQEELRRQRTLIGNALFSWFMNGLIIGVEMTKDHSAGLNVGEEA